MNFAATMLLPGPGTTARSDAALARMARQALITEAELTPKPGLVDRRGSGAHTDLTLDQMRSSAWAIEPYFARMAELARDAAPTQELREALAVVGRAAEQAMLQATSGSNAHRGAIWALGLLVSAASMTGALDALPAMVIQLAAFEDRDSPGGMTPGQAARARYGVGGARAEAKAGFPRVFRMALPVLRRLRAAGLDEQQAQLDVLMTLMAELDDTCLLYRGGASALLAAKQCARQVLAAGGVSTAAGWLALARLDQGLLQLGVSPGGSADLLAATLFVDALAKDLDAPEKPHGTA